MNSPLEIPNCNIWAHGGTLQRNHAAGLPIAIWGDQSGNGNNFVAQNSNLVVVPNALNGHQAVRFPGGPNNGTATHLKATFDYGPTQTLIVLAKFNALEAGKHLCYGVPAINSNDGQGIRVQVEADFDSGYLDLFQWRIYAVAIDESKGRLYLDGLDYMDVGGRTSGGTTALALGAHVDGNHACQCDIAEVIGYSDALTPAQISDASLYLADKYDI